MLNFFFGKAKKRVKMTKMAKLVKLARKHKVSIYQKRRKNQTKRQPKTYKRLLADVNKKMKKSVKHTKMAKLVKLARKHKVSIYQKRRKNETKRRPKTYKRLLADVNKKMKKMKFGSPFTNRGPSNYGYNQPVVQVPGALNQSSQEVASGLQNSYRPLALRFPANKTPVYGTYAEFFGQAVPRNVTPHWNVMGQQNQDPYVVGGPYYRYTTPNL